MEKDEEIMETPSMMTYVVGAVLVLAVIFGAWYFRSKGSKPTTIEPTGQPVAVATPTPGPITSLGCDPNKQYFNPRTFYPEYYLSVEGGDVSTAKEITCEFTVRVDGKVVTKATAVSPLTPAPERGGSTFRCTTNAIELATEIPTVVDVVLKDNLQATASCSATFMFPKP